jgi:hypothetical protein
VEQKIEKKEMCQCQNCGNEAEMIFTCTLPDTVANSEAPTQSPEPAAGPQEKKQVKGTATCTHCGNEADMWIDY